MLKKIFRYFILSVIWTMTIVIIFISAVLLVLGGYDMYRYYFPDRYEYWQNLIAKDPKPDGVLEEEYRAKLRAGYCWRDRRFYKPEELQQKAMVSFTDRLLGEAEAYRSDSTKLQGETSYTGADCKRNKEQKACSVWLSTYDYTNEQWDKLLLAEKNSADSEFLAQYMNKEIKQPDYLNGYFAGGGNRGFSLISRSSGKNGATIYGSDCCKVLNKKEAEPKIKNRDLFIYNEYYTIFPENDIPPNIKIEDYGIGNFYLEVKAVFPDLYQNDEKNKTYQWNSSSIFLMDNCGHLLWQPHY